MLSFVVLTVAPCIGAFLLGLVFTKRILRLAQAKRWYGPNTRHAIHTNPTPRLGGVAISLSIGVTGLVIYGLAPLVTPLAQPLVPGPEVLFWGLGLLATHTVGLLDDFVALRAVYKGTLQVVGALLALGAGVEITRITIPFTPWAIELGPFGPILALLWILGLTNAINLIDGLDGLAGGISLVALGFMGVWGVLGGHGLLAAICATAVGAIGGFLVFNKPPAKIFMGDSGSLTLGYLIATMAAWGESSSLFDQFWLLPFTLVLIPIGDTLSAILRRLKANRAIWSPDQEHIHHKLLALGLSRRGTLLVLLSVVVASSFPVLVASLTPQAPAIVIGTCLASVGLVTAGFIGVHFAYRRRFPLRAQNANEVTTSP